MTTPAPQGRDLPAGPVRTLPPPAARPLPPPAEPAATSALAAEVAARLGADRVSTEPGACRAASRDFSHLSPVLPAHLPDRAAGAVVTPRTPEEVPVVLGLAHAYGVPVTPRGRGTGNYGQGVPLAGGVVLDTSRCDRVLDVGDDWARVEAGVTFTALEAEARRHGREVAVLPTTLGSAVGGFLAGGAGGLGSLAHGWLWEGAVGAVDVAPCTPDAALVPVAGVEECRPFLHAYGVSGVVARATVRLDPARDWVGLLASADDEAAAADCAFALAGLDPAPRLVSVDDAALVATYPADAAMPPDRVSVRAVVAAEVAEEACGLVRAHGGRVEDVRPDGAAHLTTFAFNHVTLRARRARPELCHVQVGGRPLVEDPDAVRAVLPGAVLHRDVFRVRAAEEPGGAPVHGFGGLLLAPYEDEARLYAAMGSLRDLGAHVVDPHSWRLAPGDVERVGDVAVRFDPDGLLNPGSWP